MAEAGGPSTSATPDARPAEAPPASASACPNGLDALTIMVQKCGTCHGERTPTKGLDLVTPGVTARLVGVRSGCNARPFLDPMGSRQRLELLHREARRRRGRLRSDRCPSVQRRSPRMSGPAWKSGPIAQSPGAKSEGEDHEPLITHKQCVLGCRPRAACQRVRQLANATASDGVQRVAIEGFRGPQAQRIQGAVETGLVGKYYVVPDFSVEEVARRKGVGLVLDNEFAEVGKALDVRAFVSAQIQQKKAGWQVRLLVRRGDTGAPVGKILVADRRLDRLERQLAPEDHPAHRGAAGPGPAAPRSSRPRSTASCGPRPTTPPSWTPPARPRPGALFEVSADGRVFSRSFSYAQNLSGLPEYKLSGAYSGALQVAFHPGVLLDGGARKALAPVGITAALEYGLGVSSRSADSDQRLSSDVHG